ncbi:MAG: hypothetical protein IKF72_10215 [Kiritimatiellae bacterium]|nr:hypothetical protein [Kiritimatiellia bacterium]
MIKWSVLIDGLGLRVVMSKDIDGAYLAAMKEYGCKIEDILAVFCHSPFKTSMMSRSPGNKSENGKGRKCHA